MILELNKCISQHMKFGKMSDNTNLDLIIFSHPKYFLYHNDPDLGEILYKKYKQSFHVFEIINN